MKRVFSLLLLFWMITGIQSGQAASCGFHDHAEDVIAQGRIAATSCEGQLCAGVHIPVSAFVHTQKQLLEETEPAVTNSVLRFFNRHPGITSLYPAVPAWLAYRVLRI